MCDWQTQLNIFDVVNMILYLRTRFYTLDVTYTLVYRPNFLQTWFFSLTHYKLCSISSAFNFSRQAFKPLL